VVAIGHGKARQQRNSDPVSEGVPIGELRPEDRECLERITHQEGLANVFPKAAVVDGPGVPQNPAAGQSEAAVESFRIRVYFILICTLHIAYCILNL
jgi:hypothetical protein